MITNDFFQVDSFRFKPEFVSRIAIDQFDAARTIRTSRSRPPCSRCRRRSSTSSCRTAWPRASLDSQDKVADKAKAMRLSEVLRHAAGRHLVGAEDRARRSRGMRRNLQRDYLRRMAGALVKPSATCRRTWARCSAQNAIELQRPHPRRAREGRRDVQGDEGAPDREPQHAHRGAQGPARAHRGVGRPRAPGPATIGLPVVPAGLFHCAP